jgi:hypothetical protein
MWEKACANGWSGGVSGGNGGGIEGDKAKTSENTLGVGVRGCSNETI